MHANGATPGRLARFATDASRWATRNALICAEKDLAAAQDALRDASWARRAPSPPPASYVASTPVDMPRCDSNTASTDGLASMIRHDSLNDLTDLDRHVHDGSHLRIGQRRLLRAAVGDPKLGAARRRLVRQLRRRLPFEFFALLLDAAFARQ